MKTILLLILLSFMQKDILYTSQFTEFRTALNTAIIQDMALCVDQDSVFISNDCIPYHHQVYEGNISIFAEEGRGSVLVFDFRKEADIKLFGLILGSGDYTFKNITFYCKSQTNFNDASTIQIIPNSKYKISFINCTFTGNWNSQFT